MQRSSSISESRADWRLSEAAWWVHAGFRWGKEIEGVGIKAGMPVQGAGRPRPASQAKGPCWEEVSRVCSLPLPLVLSLPAAFPSPTSLLYSLLIPCPSPLFCFCFPFKTQNDFSVLLGLHGMPRCLTQAYPSL